MTPKIDIEQRVRQVVALYWAGMDFNDAVVLAQESVEIKVVEKYAPVNP